MPDLDLLSLPVLVAVLTFVTGVVTSLVVERWVGAHEQDEPGRGRTLSLECRARTAVGDHPSLTKRFRRRRAVFSHRHVELAPFRWGVRFWLLPSSPLDLASVDRGSVRRASWWLSFDASTTTCVVAVTSTGGATVELALPARDVDDVLDVLEGVPRRSRPASDLPELPRGWAWSTERTAHVTSRTPGGAAGSPRHPVDVAGQLSAALDDVEQQLAQEQVPLSGLERLRVRTTDARAVGASIPALAARLRAARAAPAITVLEVEHLDGPGALVEVDATAFTL